MEMYQEQTKFARDVAKLIQFICVHGFYLSLGEVYRTQEQAEIYVKEGKGIKNSLHCKRLAIDLNLFTKDGTYLTNGKDYQQFGVFWESLDPQNKWGGYFTQRGGHIDDPYHFQRDPE
jgi:hypothetical protein